MDSWSSKQVEAMKKGGNLHLNEYLENNGIARSTPIRDKYDNDTAQLYKLQLKARVDNQAIPTELPPPRTQHAQNKSTYQGFGSSPPPAKSNNLATAAKLAVPVALGIVALVLARR